MSWEILAKAAQGKILDHVRCLKQPVQNANRNVKFRFSLRKVGPFTAKTVTQIREVLNSLRSAFSRSWRSTWKNTVVSDAAVCLRYAALTGEVVNLRTPFPLAISLATPVVYGPRRHEHACSQPGRRMMESLPAFWLSINASKLKSLLL